MAQPVLDCPGVVAGVRQREAAACRSMLSMYREMEASTLPNAFNQAINGVRGEWSAAFGSEYKARVRELSAMVSQGSDFVTA